MPRFKARELKKMIDGLGEAKTNRFLAESLESGDIKPSDFSIRDLAENLIEDGREWVGLMNPNHSRDVYMEAAGAVSTTTFSNITGQIFFNAIKEGFVNEEFVFSNMIRTIPTQLSGEKIPGIGGIGDQAAIVGENDTYPLVGLNEDYIETPATVKRGMILPLSREVIFFDRTGILLRRAQEVGYFLGLNKEKRVINVVIDENTTAGRYKWRGTVISTYNDNTGTHTWDNLSASTPLVDWTSLDAVELLLASMLDPNTGEPIAISADTIICTPQMRHTAERILRASSVDLRSGGYATSGNLTGTYSPNPIGEGPYSGTYKVASSRQLAVQMATDTTWYLGKPSEAFAYMENWGLETQQAVANSEAEFTQDIVMRYKASERGATATLEPRLMVKATA